MELGNSKPKSAIWMDGCVDGWMDRRIDSLLEATCL